MWRVEEACLNARPSTREVLVGGQWLVRLEGGSTRRTNAVNPLRSPSYDPRPILDPAREIYRTHGQPCLFRVPSIATGLDAWLEDARFSASDEVSTLYGRLDAPATPRDPTVELTGEPSEAWLSAKFRLTPKVGAAPRPFRAMAAAILLPKAFVASRVDGLVVGVAYGAVHANVLVIEALAVDEASQRRGHGRRLVAALLAWARTEGAGAACLQVEADNGPALGLYRALGFETELYRYHYRSDAGTRSA